MKRKFWWYIGFFIVLMGAFYFLLFAGTDYYKVKLPVLTYVKEFSFIDQNGKAFKEREEKEKI